MILAYGIGDYLLAIIAVALSAIPISISVWALLDAAKRPGWAWSLANRDRSYWIAGVAFTTLLPFVGIAAAGYYLLSIRPEIDRIEQGDIS